MGIKGVANLCTHFRTLLCTRLHTFVHPSMHLNAFLCAPLSTPRGSYLDLRAALYTPPPTPRISAHPYQMMHLNHIVIYNGVSSF